MGAGNHPRTRKGQERGPRRGGKGHHGQTLRRTPRKGIPRRGDQRRPTPTERPTTFRGAPPNTHGRSKHRTPYGSHQRTPTSHRKPHGEWRPHPQRKPQRTPPHGAPPRPHHQATTPATTRATSQAPEEDEGTATATGARDRNSQRTRDQGRGPQGGQPHGRLPDPPARAARPGPDNTDPARHRHPTAPPRPPASHTPARTPHQDTGQADLH